VSVSARLERRRHTAWDVEDTATVCVAFPEASVEILLTWASDIRRNWAEVGGTAGTLELHDDTLVLKSAGPGADSSWPCPPPMSDGSHHPDWFDAVASEFLAEVVGAAPRGPNLAEARLCVALEQAARESSRQGGRVIELTGAPV
jgi:hypothetical protein